MQLTDPITKLPMVGPRYSAKLERLGIISIENLLYHVPNRYKDFRSITDIAGAEFGKTVTIKAKIVQMKNIFTGGGKRLQIAEISDNSGTMQCVWFNQMFLTTAIKKNMHFSFSGRVDLFSKNKAFISPEYENIDSKEETIHTGRLVPVYPETQGVSSKWLRQKIFLVLNSFRQELNDFIPEPDLSKLKLIGFARALESVHFPFDINMSDLGRKRLAFNELLFHQLKSLFRKKQWDKLKSSLKININNSTLKDYLDLLPFELTASQLRSIQEVFKDLKRDHPMNRLLEGDVGSGKTVVAAAACFASFVNGYQSVIMAPTQILAKQHFDTLQALFMKLKIRISLVTSVGVKADLGKSDIFIGTHALIHERVDFDKVAVVIIDEQHRFGVEQRTHLIRKSTKGNKIPNVLTMTATPIPRSVALTLYGDLDLSILEEQPTGRVPITTWVVPPQKRSGAYSWIKSQIQSDKVQVFVICPLIEESQIESMKQVKAAKQEFEDLKKEFKGYSLGLLHGKQKAAEKDDILDKFRDGNIDILVSTPVVEVGIDIPNATLMVIEAGERYGLAQLHQLRGRIGRGNKKSYCMVFTSHRSGKSNERLSALTKSLSGFELSELDLKMRGPGELMGTRQHGFPDLKIASWGDGILIKKSRDFSEKVIKNTKKYGYLIEKIQLNKISLN